MDILMVRREDDRRLACAALRYLMKHRPSSMRLEGKIISGFGGREVHVGHRHRMFRRFENEIIEKWGRRLTVGDMAQIEAAALAICKANADSVDSIENEHPNAK